MDLISALKQDQRMFGDCPHCGEEFRLGSAKLFSADDNFPDEVLARIAEMKQSLKDRRQELEAMKHRMTDRARITAESVNLGKILEKIAPSFDGFQYPTQDCRSLFEPIDYVIFSGMSTNGAVDALVFLDVKSGAARLTRTQKEIAGVVQRGDVRVEVIQSRNGV